MSVKAVQISAADNKRNKYNLQKANQDVSFGSLGNPVITLMDAIERGGFAASFITQDFLGMAAPRVGAGMYRNHDKTGQLNWDFAFKEGTREILSGPSTFLIPAGIMWGVKKASGSANDVPVDFINGFGEMFAKYAEANKAALGNAEQVKLGLYTDTFKNILSSSTNNGLKGEQLEKSAKDFASRLIAAEKAPSKGFFNNLIGKAVPGSAQDLKQSLLDDFAFQKKQFLGADGDKIVAEFTTAGDKKIGASFKSILKYMRDYSDDAIKTVNKKLASGKEVNVEEFIKKLSQRRSGTRFLSNAAMFFAVVSFYTVIPKLYNLVTKGKDPGLKGLGIDDEVQKSAEPVFGNNNTEKTNDTVSSQPSFTGYQSQLEKLGKQVSKSSAVKSFSEFEGTAMSMPAMLTLLFGFCLPSRLINAQSNTDRKEILMRDVTSFFAILFGAKTINRICSDVFAKQSGLALSVKPADHNKSVFKKMWHYIYPAGGVQVLDSDRIISNYSDVASYQNGLNDMFEFVNNNGGNVGKMLNIDPDIKAAATGILGKTPDKDMKYADIIKKFEDAKGTEAYNKIINALSNKGNTLVKRAKTLNSAFGFASTILLVPALMIWIAKHCEKMTKKHVEEQKAESMKNMARKTQVPDSMRVVTNKPTMAGFLHKAD